MPTRINPDQTSLRVAGTVLYHYVEGELVVLNWGTGKYLKLNAIGGRIFELLADSGDVQAVIATLAAEYDVEGCDVRQDVEQLVEKLCAHQLLERHCGEASARGAAA